MSLHPSLLALAASAGLWLGAGPALAQQAEDAPPPLPGVAFCKENPGRCEQARARREAFCQENPERCEQRKQKAAERRAWCEKNPEECEQQRARMKERRAELQARCAEDPAKCDERKAQARERWKARRGGAPAPAE